MIPKVSVVVPVWNVEKYLRECLDSVINQTLREIEIILIDDGSTDASLAICREYAQKDKRISVYTQPNTGAGSVRNRGIELAEGEYLSFLDADDFFELNMLEKMYCKAKVTDADIVGCDFWLFDEKDKKDSVVTWSVRKENLPSKKVFCAMDCPNTIFNIFCVIWNQLYKKSFILEKGLYYQNLKNTNDVFFLTTALCMASKITFLNKRFIHYRKYQGSTVTRREEDWKACWKAREALRNFLIDKNIFEKFQLSFLCKTIDTLALGYKLREPCLGMFENYMLKNFSSLIKNKAFHFLPDNLQKKLNHLFMKRNISSFLEDFYYYKRDKIIPIVFAVNEKYVPYVAVTIQSIIEHVNSERFYDIYILYTALEEKSQDSLEELTHDNVRVTCLNISGKIKGIPFYDKAHFSLIMWYRLIIPELFYGYDKVLYLDTDIIIKDDISRLFDTDLKDYWLAACRAINLYEYAEEKLDLIGENYFNSGVLLFNIPKWEKNDLTQKCLRLIDPENKYVYPDQDILNIICQNNTLILSSCWNCHWYYFELKNSPWFLTWYLEVFKNAKIIHYSSPKKPWDNPKEYLADRWWKYARKSPFYEQILLQNMPQRMENKPIVLTKTPLMAQKETLYSDMAKYVWGTFICFFLFGEKKEKRQVELGKLLLDMFKKV